MATGETEIPKLDRLSDEPLWSQLVNALLSRIAAGIHAPDQALPSEAELSAMYGVSRTVVRVALSEMAHRRQIYKIKGKGTFVSPVRPDLRFVGSITGSAEDLLASGQKVMTRILAQTIGPASLDEAMALGIDTTEEVVRLERVRLVSGAPWMVVQTSLPASLVPGLEHAKLENRSLYEVLRRQYDLVPAGADRWLEAVMPTAATRELLQAPPGTPVLSIESVSWTRSGQRFEWYKAIHRSDQARFRVTIRE